MKRIKIKKICSTNPDIWEMVGYVDMLDIAKGINAVMDWMEQPARGEHDPKGSINA